MQGGGGEGGGKKRGTEEGEKEEEKEESREGKGDEHYHMPHLFGLAAGYDNDDVDVIRSSGAAR